MIEWITGAIETLGYWGIALLMFLENIFPPLPSELIMPLAGFTTSKGELTFWGVVIAGAAGSIIGQLPLYFAARRLGERRLRRLVDHHGRWLTLSGEDLDRAQHWFERHGGRAVFIARLIPGVRSLISISAGLAGMHLLRFLIYSALGISLWTILLAGLGNLLGENYQLVSRYLSPISYVIIGGLIIGAGIWFYKRKCEQREEREPEPESERLRQRS